MSRKFTVVAVLVTLIASGLVIAQPMGGDFVISKSTIDNGGGASSGGDFVLIGTIGQPDANTVISSGNQFQIAGGFWTRLLDADLVFKDGFE